MVTLFLRGTHFPLTYSRELKERPSGRWPSPPIAQDAAWSSHSSSAFVSLIYSWEAEANKGVIITCCLPLLTFSDPLLLVCWLEPPPHAAGKWQRCCWCPSRWLRSHKWAQPSVLPVDLTRVKYKINMMKAAGGRLIGSWRQAFSFSILLFSCCLTEILLKVFIYLLHGAASEQCCYCSCRKPWRASSGYLTLAQQSHLQWVTELLPAGVSALWFTSSGLQEKLGWIPQEI